MKFMGYLVNKFIEVSLTLVGDVGFECYHENPNQSLRPCISDLLGYLVRRADQRENLCQFVLDVENSILQGSHGLLLGHHFGSIH